MKRATRLIAVGLAWLLGAGVILWQGRAMIQRRSASRAVMSPAVKTPTPPPAEPSDLHRRRLDRQYAATRWSHWSGSQVDDPFGRGVVHPSPLTTPVVSAASVLQVSATWLQTGQRLAVINGRLLGEGASLDSFRVERIEAGVVLVKGPSGLERLSVSPFDPSSGSTNSSPPVRPPADGSRRAPG